LRASTDSLVTSMNELQYIKFDSVDENEFISILNRQRIREHLIEHDFFDGNSIRDWIELKMSVDSTPGCKIRAIKFEGKLIGWCGIQLELERYEIAIVLDHAAWGKGKRVFADLMAWAKELGHKDIFINLLHSRRENRYLARMAINISHSEIHGSKFTTYQINLN